MKLFKIALILGLIAFSTSQEKDTGFSTFPVDNDVTKDVYQKKGKTDKTKDAESRINELFTVDAVQDGECKPVELDDKNLTSRMLDIFKIRRI